MADMALYTAVYESVPPALADLDAIEELHKDEMIGKFDAAVIDQEDGKPHIVKRVDRPRVRIIPELFGGGALPRKELKEAATELTSDEAGLILIGEDTRAAAGDAILVRRLDWVAVYGRTQGLAVYELLGMADLGALQTPEWVTAYEAGLDAYARRDWAGAAALFESAIAHRGDDLPSRIFVERCRNYLASPPPGDWTAVSILAEK